MSHESFVPLEGRTGSRSLLRRMNSLGILREIMAEPRSTTELATGSGLSRTAVDSVVGDLVDMGWLAPRSAATPPKGPGRPASIFDLATRVGHLLSIDIGANHAHAVVADLTGSVLAIARIELEETLAAEDRVRSAVSVGQQVLSEAHLTSDDVWAVTIGTPGVVDKTGKIVHFGGTGMPGWVGLDINAAMREHFDCAVFVEGDVALAAHAELAIGQAQGYEDVVYVLCGSRTSGALIVGGAVHRGVHGAAGIVGELDELRWAELSDKYASDILPAPRPSRIEIFDRARNGEALYQRVITEFADDLAMGTAALVLAIDPDRVIVGGGSASGADLFLPRMTERLGELCPIVPDVVASKLGSEAVALGGISLAQTRLQSRLADEAQNGSAFPDPLTARALFRA